MSSEAQEQELRTLQWLQDLPVSVDRVRREGPYLACYNSTDDSGRQRSDPKLINTREGLGETSNIVILDMDSDLACRSNRTRSYASDNLSYYINRSCDG